MTRKNPNRRSRKRMWLRPSAGPLLFSWPMLPIPGVELVVFAFNHRLDVYYMVTRDEQDWVLRVDKAEELAQGRERWRLAFTCGQA